ncbi:MAG: radical SAM protein [Spirochaetes bacterium]|nr:MAG: radical SAM protein [Spirochaetota bacterium]RKX98081.1 MAG: radical SAM protein [Spirochaetota bacterium]
MNDDSYISYKDLGNILNSVEKPGRYVGGEFGAITGIPGKNDLKVCIVFPDLYEIGMSNQAVRILYKLFNETPGIHAERAFSPAPDFQTALEENHIPIYSLENGIPASDFDVLAVTVGYELSFSNFLSFLKAGNIPIRSKDRNNSHPLIIAGGPAMTNPAPWGEFLDAVFIGEAEGPVPEDLLSLKSLKSKGAGRAELLTELEEMKGYWTPANPITNRISWIDFGKEKGSPAVFPIPSMIPVQDHGVIEIMRGCPNKCRFCHAGVFYRPFRQKSMQRVLEEAEFLVNECGYRDITLSSLSTGDYSNLEPLVEQLNALYSDKRISFSLPSLRVNSITLSLIGNLGAVRKSGLTFAVETPTVKGQKGINKEVPADRVIEILREAKREGWKLAKFYFMLGLPVDNGDDEASAIVNYLINIQKSTGMNLNVNLGTFIPKPHTPFQRSAQLTDEEAITKIRQIKDGLRSNKRIRFSFHSPYVSFLEGILSRGTEKSGELAYQAWLNGACFDAWDDRMDRDAWRKAIAEADWDVEKESCRERAIGEVLPWESISLGVSDEHLDCESRRSKDGTLTVPCAVVCTDHCGVCNKADKVTIPEEDISEIFKPAKTVKDPSKVNWQRLLLTFRKYGPAIYLGHLDVMNVFERALQRTGLTIDFSRGFNPKPKIEFAQPLSLGITSKGEICTVQMEYIHTPISTILEKLNISMPSGFEVIEASWIAPVPEGKKTVKVMGAFWGSDWEIEVPEELSTSEQLMKELDREIKVRGVSDDFHMNIHDDSRLFVRLRHGGTRHHNLMRILESIYGKPSLQTGIRILRSACWASDSNGSPIKYEIAFPS